LAASDEKGLFGKLALPIAIVALALGAFLIIRNLGGSNIQGLNQPKWMYNLTTGELVARGAEETAPADLDGSTFDYGDLGSGGPLVDAYVFTCGDPLAIKEGMSADDLKAVDARLGYVLRQAVAGQTGEVVSDASGREWAARTSQRGIKLAMAAAAACPDGKQPLRSVPH